MDKRSNYEEVFKRLDALCKGETDHIALMATICCELFHSFEYFDWVGFYRNIDGEVLKIGPYQGTHGCLVIPFSKGVCGKCATEKKIQNVSDVSKIPYHIACSSTTRSEIVVPIVSGNELIAVLDIDSNTLAAFDEVDEEYLCQVNKYFR